MVVRLARPCRHGLHVPSSGRTHGCHRQRAKYSRSQKGNCRGRTTPHETHARRSGCSGLLANPGNPNHAGRVGPLRGSAQAHSRSATMDAVGKDHNGTRRRIGPSGIRHGGACPSDALGEGKWLPQDILAERPSYVRRRRHGDPSPGISCQLYTAAHPLWVIHTRPRGGRVLGINCSI